MKKIKWCLNVKNGLELVEPSENMSRIYLLKSEDAINAASVLNDNRDWEISSSYYAMYFALYSILMRVGVKCENHSCTIEFMEKFLLDYFNDDDVTDMRNAMKLRIDAQYYADREISVEKYKKMVTDAPRFLTKCKEALYTITENEITEIQNRINLV
ncbi:HEPN domain-containing protein [archaeon]|nr:HEPN domain-containing protein [archaeon]